jgi:fructuronate reductase/mannitol 2-dehydrogenase
VAGPTSFLNAETLEQQPGRVAVPTYDRRALSPGVVHIGVGGFHRAHQAAYFDDLAERGVSHEWGVIGVGLRRREMKQGLAPQDCLYTMVERSAEADRARVIGAMLGCMFAPERPVGVLAALTDPRTRLVTLTITGEGYAEEPAPGDLAGAPCTAFGYLVEALARRRRAGTAPFTVLSCDNVPDNGEAARGSVMSIAARRDELLARWIEHRVSFPNSVVDRITPQATAATRGLVEREFGIRDRRPVVTEPFTQWIVEDAFCNERPPLEEVGVQFVGDVASHQLMKKRLLNGGHCAVAYLATLAGYERIDEALADWRIREYLERLLAQEIVPLLPDIPGVDLHDYCRTLVSRFANPRIGDDLARLCRRGSTKMSAYLLPSLVEAVARGGPHELLTLAVAGWFRYLGGRDDAGRPIEVRDPRLAALRAHAHSTDPRGLIASLDALAPLRGNELFAARLERSIRSLDRFGALGLLENGAR